jgi:hypothetical protein
MLYTMVATTCFGAVFINIETEKSQWAKSLWHTSTLHTRYAIYCDRGRVGHAIFVKMVGLFFLEINAVFSSGIFKFFSLFFMLKINKNLIIYT